MKFLANCIQYFHFHRLFQAIEYCMFSYCSVFRCLLLFFLFFSYFLSLLLQWESFHLVSWSISFLFFHHARSHSFSLIFVMRFCVFFISLAFMFSFKKKTSRIKVWIAIAARVCVKSTNSNIVIKLIGVFHMTKVF